MYDMKYNNELDKYAKQHKLYISNELMSERNDYSVWSVVNKVIVKWKDITIIDIKTKGIINDDELLKLIKREINLIELGV